MTKKEFHIALGDLGNYLIDDFDEDYKDIKDPFEVIEEYANDLETKYADACIDYRHARKENDELKKEIESLKKEKELLQLELTMTDSFNEDLKSLIDENNELRDDAKGAHLIEQDLMTKNTELAGNYKYLYDKYLITMTALNDTCKQLADLSNKDTDYALTIIRQLRHDKKDWIHLKEAFMTYSEDSLKGMGVIK